MYNVSRCLSATKHQHKSHVLGLSHQHRWQHRNGEGEGTLISHHTAC